MKQRPTKVRVNKAATVGPEPRSGHSLLVSEDGGTVYVVGGHAQRGPLSDIWSYSTGTGDWKRLQNEATSEPSPLMRLEYATCLVGPFIYLFGGFQSDGEDVSILNDLWVFDLEFQSWNLISEECSAPERSGHVAVALDSARFLIHGGTCMGSRGDLWVYDTSSGQWEEIISTESPCARSMHSAVLCQESKTLAIFGGVTDQGSSPDANASPNYLNDLWVMHLTENTKDWKWSMVNYSDFAPSPRDLPALVSLGSGVVLFGGFGFIELLGDLSDNEDGDNEHPELTSPVARSLSFTGNERLTFGRNKGLSATDMKLPSERRSNSPPRRGKSPAKKEGKGVVFEEKTEENDDDDDDSMLAIDYLADAWYIDLESGDAIEFDLSSMSIVGGEQNAEDAQSISNVPRRGCQMVNTKGGKIVSFGGFDGEGFYGMTEEIDVAALQDLCDEIQENEELTVKVP